MTGTVDVRVEHDALFADLSERSQAEYLKPAAVCENRLVPVHKLVQAAELFHNLVSGTNVKMIGIGQFNLCTDLLQICGSHRTLDSCNGTHIHKNRCLNDTMYGFHMCALCSAVCCNDLIHILTFILIIV